jgi:hypothetical protein
MRKRNFDNRRRKSKFCDGALVDKEKKLEITYRLACNCKKLKM